MTHARSNVNKGIDWLISRKTCLNRFTNFDVPSEIEIKLQFIVLYYSPKYVAKFCAPVAFIRSFQNFSDINC